MAFAKDSQQVKFWLALGFTRHTLRMSVPDPALFRTEEEASDWCEQHSNKSVIYGTQMVRLGRMT